MPSSLHLVDPDFLPLIDFFPAAGFNAETLGPIREMVAALPRPPAPDDGVAVSERTVPGPAEAPDVRVVIYTPTRSKGPYPVVVHLHGGGYVIGSPELADTNNRLFASSVGCMIVSVDYRLAPEAVFPAAVEDSYAALKWVHAHVASIGGDPGRLAVMGESAGGGLAAGLALLTRDRGEVPLIGQILIYPMIDDRNTDPATAHPYAGEYVWTMASNQFGWTSLLGKKPGGADTSPYAAAARAADLAGLPPTFVSLGDLDLFLEEDLDYVRRLTRAGVPVELHMYAGAIHGYTLLAEAPTAKQAVRDQIAAMRRILKTAG